MREKNIILPLSSGLKTKPGKIRHIVGLILH